MASGFFIAFVLSASGVAAQTPDQVLVVVNRRSVISREIGEYYLHKRAIPLANLCSIDTAPVETIERPVYDKEIEAPIARFLRNHGLQEKILYIVLTSGVPLRINGPGEEFRSEAAAVDSELTLLYSRMRGVSIPLAGPARNPFFRQRDTPFRHPLFPIYLVTRLDGYNMADMKALVDRGLAARNTGKFAIDLKAGDSTEGNQWLRAAALLLPKDRVVLDDSATVLTGIQDVLGYASWGSNDTDRRRRFLHFKWLPGAIATEFVLNRRANLPGTAGQLGTGDLEQQKILVRRRAAVPDGGLHSRRRDGRVGPGVRAVPGILSPARLCAARLLFRTHVGRELLSWSARTELDDCNHRRSAGAAEALNILRSGCYKRDSA